MKRRLEFVEGSSFKFYEVEVTDQSVTTTFGRIGTDGQTQTKHFGDRLAAQNHADKLVRQKLAKGYVQQQEA